ncbi:MAG: VOC family protein [Ekhidna sp.]
METTTPFHLAIPVRDLNICRQFYRDVLECSEGRSSARWVDFNLFGHQLVIHQAAKRTFQTAPITNAVDGHQVPVPHFGVVLPWDKWSDLAEMLKRKGMQFILEPSIRFQGEVGEQATMFFCDPEGNALEFKALRNVDQLFSA